MVNRNFAHKIENQGSGKGKIPMMLKECKCLKGFDSVHGLILGRYYTFKILDGRSRVFYVMADRN